MMIFVNEVTAQEKRPRKLLELFVLVLAPYAPHLAEELWQSLGHAPSLAHAPWPAFDEAMLVEDTVEVPVQVNGKLRGKIVAPAGSDNAALESLARADAKVAEHLAGKTAVKIIVVPGKLVNFVVK